MKLHTKLILSLLCVLVVVVGASQLWQGSSNVAMIRRMSDNNSRLLKEITVASAKNVFHAAELAVAASLQRGEMEKFGRLIEAQKALEGVKEFSLFDRKGVITYSSEKSAIGREMSPAMRGRIGSTFDPSIEETPDSIEILHPQKVTADCIRCHTSWKENENGGTTYLKFSREAVKAIEAEAESELAEARADSLRNAFGVLAATIVLVTLTMRFVVNRVVRVPLTRCVSLLSEIRRGNLKGRLHLTGSDEIAEMAGALDRMADGLEGKVRLARNIADGDLSQRVELASDEDDFGKALQAMTASLNDIIGQVSDTTEQVTGGASEVSNASTELSEGATKQAAAVEEISASLLEVASQTRTNADNAGIANKIAAEAQTAAQEGSTRMRQMISAMSEIQGSSAEVVKIVKVIDDIAFQTNLLALNAAVEAARAGRHGKGFAVVAEEVRNLAARSAKAARETTEGIEGSLRKIAEGAQVSAQTSEALTHIGESVKRVYDLVTEISAASTEQAHAVDQITKGMSQIDTVTQQNSASAEETASASSELRSEANKLQELLGRFRLAN